MTVYDVLVIGGGIAGTAAALAVRTTGRRRVALVTDGPGATALAGGGWTGPLPGPLADALADAGLPYPRLAPVGSVGQSAGRLPHPSGDLRRCDHAGETHVGAAALDGALVCGITGLASFPAAPLARSWSAATAASSEPTAATVTLPDTPRR
ncbi:MAG: FAD-binding protein, partial [Gemmatimonadota bacterium]